MLSHQFKTIYNSKISKARRGKLITPHGIVETPAFVTVGTKATVKSLSAEDLELTGTQFIFVNTYHMVLSPGADIVYKAGGIHKFSQLNKPIITDSGGFQVFSLARRQIKVQHDDGTLIKASLVKINDDGVEFRSHIDGTKYIFTPEFSIKEQQKIGGDFIVAFDECLHYGATKKQTEYAMRRTHNWALRSLKVFNKHKNQHMYGVIQGGVFEDLRKKSTEFIAEQSFFGIAIGGVSVGESTQELRMQIQWVMEVLHADQRPRHVLGISTLQDIIFAVQQGVDTFDCVIPTRSARIGFLYDVSFEALLKAPSIIKDTEWTFDITNKKNKNDLSPISSFCDCYTCKNYSRAYLHHLFIQRELLAYRLATIHNLYFIEQFFSKIRQRIEEGNL